MAAGCHIIRAIQRPDTTAFAHSRVDTAGAAPAASRRRWPRASVHARYGQLGALSRSRQRAVCHSELMQPLAASAKRTWAAVPELAVNATSRSALRYDLRVERCSTVRWTRQPERKSDQLDAKLDVIEGGPEQLTWASDRFDRTSRTGAARIAGMRTAVVAPPGRCGSEDGEGHGLRTAIGLNTRLSSRSSAAVLSFPRFEISLTIGGVSV